MSSGAWRGGQTSRRETTPRRTRRSERSPASGETNREGAPGERQASKQRRVRREQQAWPTFYIL